MDWIGSWLDGGNAGGAKVFVIWYKDGGWSQVMLIRGPGKLLQMRS